MFKSLFEPKKPVFDPALGDRLGTKLLAEAQQGKLDLTLKEVASLRNGQWDRRAFYIDMVGHYVSGPEKFDALPDTALANLLKGTKSVYLAWDARGGGGAETVSQDGWKQFIYHLDQAAKLYLRAAEQDAEDPTPFALLQTVAMGMQLERATAQAWLAEALKRDPFNQQAHFRHLTLLTKKWGGSHEDMYAFARETVSKSPPSSTLPSILYLAFQEHFLYLRAFDNNVPGSVALANDKAVREESVSVYQNSLQKRKSIEQVSDYWPHNLAVWWFLALGIHDAVRQETKKIGPYFTEYPWRVFFRDPAEGYLRALKI